jgi:glycosyltransferase involved in cell wall biosynthesis
MPVHSSVLHVINTPGPGGAETVCANIIRGMGNRGWKSVGVAPGPGWLHQEITDAGAEAIILDASRHADLPGYVATLIKVIRQRGVRLIHSHLFGPSYIAALAALATKTPLICTLHGQVDLHPRESFRTLKFGLINKAASRVVFVSASLRAFFLDAGLSTPESSAVIPNGINIGPIDSGTDLNLRAELGISTDEFLVGAVGNVRPAKAYDVLLRAAALLKNRSEGYRFAVFGEVDARLGDELNELRDELDLTDAFSFVGFRKDIPNVMRSLDAYALTSRSEGFSISTVEAMASRLPVVATRCGGPEEIIEHGKTGILVSNKSVSEIAEAIHGLRMNPALRERLGNAARTDVESRFTLDAQLNSYEALYNDCLRTNTRERTRTTTPFNLQTMRETLT